MPRDIQTVRFWRGRLPHWEVDRGVYFITIREHGSLPEDVLRKLRAFIQEIKASKDRDQQSRLHRRIFLEMERGLDRPDATGRLTIPAVARIVSDSIAFREREGIWQASEYAIMPNHLHLLIQITRGGMFEVMRSFKHWVTSQTGKVIDLGKKPLWQGEWFDHFPRGSLEDERIAEYIRNNPVKAKLVREYQDWAYGSWKR